MKTLSPSDLVELLKPNPHQLADGLSKFELTAPILCREPGYIKQLVAEGWIETRIVAVNGQPAFLIGWHISPDQGFWFDLVISFQANVHYGICVATVENLARELGCRYIRWVTLRRGIVRWAQEGGYEAEAVILTKKL